MSKPSKKVVELLNRTAAYMLQRPEGYNQQYFIKESNDVPCGTECCIAGYIVMVNDPKEYMKLAREITTDRYAEQSSKIENIARQLMGKRHGEEFNLFAGSGEWPSQFKSAYRRASSAKGRVKVAVARIRHYIKTGK